MVFFGVLGVFTFFVATLAVEAAPVLGIILMVIGSIMMAPMMVVANRREP